MTGHLLRCFFRSWVTLPTALVFWLVIIAASFIFGGKPSTEATNIDWQLLEQVKFNSTWYAPYKANVQTPMFSDTVTRLNGKEVEITGYFIPMELNSTRCALSKNPNSTCFFCGKATIETIMIIEFKDKVPNFTNDDLITVRGRLRITHSFNDFIYQLVDAILIRNSK
jgi:hypothetical protein